MSLDYIQANTDGRLHAATEPSISPLNRGFLYGDAIYEVWRTYNGVIFGWEEHWDRLQRSADALYMELPLDPKRLLEEIRRTAQAFSGKIGAKPELYIRLQVSRGAGGIGLNPALADRGSFVLLIQTLKVPSDAVQRNGMKLGLATRLKRNHASTLNPAWKTGNYLNNILCLREAVAKGADEVVMSNLAGELTESAVSNLGFVRDGVLFTPPLSAGILEGITRDILLRKIAPQVGVRVDENPIPLEALPTFSECFISSTTRELTPVASIDDVRYQVSANSVTNRLKDAFHAYALDVVSKRPDLAVY
jgi:branched-chain amino acid aminotransferase